MSSIVDKLKQYPVAVLCFLVLLICAGGAFLRAGLIDELSTKETELIARLRTINENIKNSKNLDKDLEALEANVALIDERLFSRDERSVNTNFFYSFEDDFDISISDVNQLSVEDPAFIKGGPNELKIYSGISYGITVTGTFEQILRFAYEIHNAEALMRLADYEVSVASRKTDGAGILSARLRVVVLAHGN